MCCFAPSGLSAGASSYNCEQGKRLTQRKRETVAGRGRMVVVVGERQRGCSLWRGSGRSPGDGQATHGAGPHATPCTSTASYQEGFWRGRSKIARAASRSHAIAWRRRAPYIAALGRWRDLGAHAELIASQDDGYVVFPHSIRESRVFFRKIYSLHMRHIDPLYMRTCPYWNLSND